MVIGSPPVPFQTLFDHATVTGMAKEADATDYMMGPVVRFAVDSYVDAISAWVPVGSTVEAGIPRTCGIWTFAGAELGRGVLYAASEPAAGNWVDVSLNEPVPVTAGVDYIIGFNIHNGGYSAQAGGFNSAVTRGDITAPATASVAGGNARYRVGQTFNVPNTNGSGANYYVDCRFKATSAPAFAIPAGYPNASNTGPSGALTPSGSVTSSSNGQTIENLDITGSVTISHDNVTLRNCRVRLHDDDGTLVMVTGADVLIEDCEIDGLDGSYIALGIGNGSGTIRACNIHHAQDGIVAGNDLTVEDCYIHSLLSTQPDPHYDAFECNGGSNITLEHNTLINDFAQTSAVMFNNFYSPVDNILVNDNVIVGGAYALYVSAQFSGGTVTDVTVSNNKMVPGTFGYFAFTSTNPTYTGNTNVYSGLAI
jgi:hypothetical protein